jgi:hypothetical protein
LRANFNAASDATKMQRSQGSASEANLTRIHAHKQHLTAFVTIAFYEKHWAGDAVNHD